MRVTNSITISDVVGTQSDWIRMHFWSRTNDNAKVWMTS